MITFRFYLVSLVAVFLAIALGVTVGSTFLQPALVQDLNNQMASVRQSLDDRVERIDELNGQIQDLERFREQAAPYAVDETLVGSETLVIAEEGADVEAVERLVGRLRQADTVTEGIVWLQPEWGSGDGTVEVLGALGLTGVSPLDRDAVRSAVLGAAVAELAPRSGGSGVDPAAPDATTTVPPPDDTQPADDPDGDGIGEEESDATTVPAEGTDDESATPGTTSEDATTLPAGDTDDETAGTDDETAGTDDEAAGTDDEAAGTDDEAAGTDDETTPATTADPEEVGEGEPLPPVLDLAVLDLLEDTGWVRRQRIEATDPPSATGAPPAVSTVGVVLVTAPRHDSEERLAGLLDLARQLALAEIPTVQAEAHLELVGDDGTTAQRGIALAGVRDDPELASLVSTVDSLDMVEGQVAAVLALAERHRGGVGHYGVGRGAERVLPAWPGP